MKTRMTAKRAHEEIDLINESLTEMGHNCRVKMSHRYNYQGLDLFEGKSCLRTIATGTPRECVEAAHGYCSGVSAAIARKRLEALDISRES